MAERPPIQGGDGGSSPTSPLHFAETSPAEVNALLLGRHYLGPFRQSERGVYAFVGLRGGYAVAGAIWKRPTSRRLPSDGSWLELARWVLTPGAGKNAGSRMHGWTVRWLRQNDPRATTLVSYSDPSVGHTGALYKSCGWLYEPTWVRLQPPPSGGGSWDGKTNQAPKDRWVFRVRPDTTTDEVIAASRREWPKRFRAA